MTRAPRIPGKETDLERRCVIPVPGSTIVKPGTLQSILRGAVLSTEEFRKLL